MGGDLLVRGATALARRARVSPLLVAATVVAFGTSIPELVVALQAALTGYPGIVIGNVVGSNIANILLVGGATAVVYPLSSGGGTIKRDAALMLFVTGLFVLLCITLPLHRAAGLILLVALGGILALALKDAARDRSTAELTPLDWVLGLPSRTWMILLFIALGVVGLPLGAHLVVEGAVVIADSWGVSEAVVGLSLLAFSTSLPELATSIVAAIQQRTEVAMGTLIGSNLLNIVAIMSVSSVVSREPIPVPDGFVGFDLPVMFLTALLATVLVWISKPIGRVVGGAMVASYVVYVAALFLVG